MSVKGLWKGVVFSVITTACAAMFPTIAKANEISPLADAGIESVYIDGVKNFFCCCFGILSHF